MSESVLVSDLSSSDFFPASSLESDSSTGVDPLSEVFVVGAFSAAVDSAVGTSAFSLNLFRIED